MNEHKKQSRTEQAEQAEQAAVPPSRKWWLMAAIMANLLLGGMGLHAWRVRRERDSKQ
jgi:hypothetical protein